MKHMELFSKAMGGVSADEAVSFWLHLQRKGFAITAGSVTRIRDSSGRVITARDWEVQLNAWLIEERKLGL